MLGFSRHYSYIFLTASVTIFSYGFFLYKNYNCYLSGTNTISIQNPRRYIFSPTNGAASVSKNDLNSIPGTTGTGIPNFVRSILSTKYGGTNESTIASYEVDTAIDRLEKQCAWNSTSLSFIYPECMEQFQFVRHSPVFNISNFYDKVDIVIHSLHDLDFLHYWRPFFRYFHIIIIQDADPDKLLRIPYWADYELYNIRDIKAALGENRAWIISSEDASIRNFGFLISKKPYIYTINEDCLPASNNNGEKIDALSRHIQNLVTNSTPYFFNTLYDPYRAGSDFVRGYPYSLRRGVPTAISHGIWANSPDYDAPTQLLKLDERNNQLVDVTVTIPAGTLYSMCSMNVAFNRELIGPAFMQGLMVPSMSWARYDDLFAGWASKVIADHLGLGVKTGAPYIQHNRASNPFTDLKNEFKWLFWQDEMIEFFQQIRLPASLRTPEECYLELARMIRSKFLHLNEYFGKLATAMEVWVDLWGQAKKNAIMFKPSRYKTPRVLTNRTAIFTISRNEAGYLPIWLRYYQKYFPDEDIYILDNDSSDGSTDNLTVNVQRVHSSKYFDHLWIHEVVQDMFNGLLDFGYKYVLFADVDEMVVPDPAKYPLGLSEYINRINKSAVRVTCYDIRHNVSAEAKLDLNRSILEQRRFWMRHDYYDKPLLANKTLHWSVGFHHSQEQVDRDNDLYMFHLQRMDHDFYMQRAEWKSRQDFKQEDIRRGFGVQQHYHGETAEKFFREIIGKISEIPPSFRSKPFF